ncbi:MAG: hypothetical protein JWR18_1242 [Segetibacter sp.]|nr:hypothetical protein [Segetibacter sp.]
MIDFTDKNVLITGGSRGIGRACAKLFSDLNANVIFTYKSNKDEAQKTFEMLNPKQNNSMYELEISKPEEIECFFSAVLEKYQRIDVLVNNAGVYIEHKINEVSYPEWQQVWNETLTTNLNGVSNLCYFAGRRMSEQNKENYHYFFTRCISRRT